MPKRSLLLMQKREDLMIGYKIVFEFFKNFKLLK